MLFAALIRLAQGDRPGAVESWNRYFQRRGIRTQAPQLVVEAVADPRGRPAALAAIDDLPPDEFVFYSSVVLGDADRAVRVVQDLEPRHGRNGQRHLVGPCPTNAPDRGISPARQCRWARAAVARAGLAGQMPPEGSR